MVRFLYKIISWITETFPNKGARFIDSALFFIVGNILLHKIILAWNVHLLKKVKKFEKICVIADVNIGDAVMNQSFISALRDYFPESCIDYVIKRSALHLVRNNKEISHVWPIYTTAPFPSEHDIREVNTLINESDFDVIFNFSPFLSSHKIKIPRRISVVGFFGIVPTLLQAQKNKKDKSHMMLSGYRFIHELFSRLKKPAKKTEFLGVSLILSQDTLDSAKKILIDKNSNHGTSIVFLNTDTSSRFTQIPFDIQKELLKKIINLTCDVLLGGGPSHKDFAIHLIDTIPLEKRNKIRIVPITTPLDVFAVLIDYCDVFITGDTGSLHMAAARKYAQDGNFQFRNKTTVFSIFGATPPRVYGYDSQMSGFFVANQDAVSRVYIGNSHCRNLTYINKNDIMCNEQCFFNDINVDKIIDDIQMFIKN